MPVSKQDLHVAADAAIADLRHPQGWARWVRLQAERDARLLAQAAMQYRPEQDTIHLLFGYDMLSMANFRSAPQRVADLMQSFYDERRSAWLANLRGTSLPTRVPKHVVMPRLEIEIAPPRGRSH